MDTETISGLEAGVVDWLRQEREVRSSLGMLDEPDETAAPMPFDQQRQAAVLLGDRLARRTALQVDPAVQITEIPLPTAGGESFGRVYEPPNAGAVVPTQLFLHGGGFAFGSARELVNDALLSARAAATGIRIVSYEYELAPEHPYPAARDGSVLAFQYLHGHAAELGIDAGRLGIGGVSAGGSLAASAALVLARAQAAGRGGPAPCHVALEVPALSADLLGALPADAHPILAVQQAEYAGLVTVYLPQPDELAFVAEAASLVGFPPTLMVLAEFDLVTASAAGFAERLRAQGTAVHTEVRRGQIHGSPGATAVSAGARAWQQSVAEQLRAAYRTN